MQGLRRAVVVTLLLAPFVLLLAVAGVLFLHENRWLMKWVWVPLPFCWLLAYWVYRGRRQSGSLLWQPERNVSLHWTRRDEEAWGKVQQYADRASEIPRERFFATQLYVESVEQLARQLAEHYHPGASHPLETLTVPEILTAVELATADLREFVEDYVPGGHLVTIRWLRRATQLPESWRRFRPLYDAVSLLWNPFGVVYRTVTGKTVVDPMMNELEQDAMRAIYQAFILSIGKYLIELDSRRLKVGPDRWRRHLASEQGSPASESPESDGSQTKETQTSIEIRIAVVGQVKAGKSSLINALIRQQQSAVDLLPATRSIHRFTLESLDNRSRAILLDTVGYAHRGQTADQIDETMRAVCQSAMTVLVLDASQPARDPDVVFLHEMDRWFAEHPQRKRPPVLAVVTHIDCLPPVLEWDPPYDQWIEPDPVRTKDRNIRAVIESIQEMLAGSLSGIVPACTDIERGRDYGVEQWVVPALLSLLPEAEGKALVDRLYAELDRGRFSKLLTQVWNTSSLLARYGFSGPQSVLPDPPDGRKQFE